ncbi:MAG: hypothetical protein KKE00_02290 [Proteobacteria bacterium]|nr:hypothetical protein [Pseudomonadota bacterium]MBU1569343.1 hypothetical protein [Pseudomonadota bacterium]
MPLIGFLFPLAALLASITLLLVLLSFVILPIPLFRFVGKRILFGIVGAGIGLGAYQLAFVVVLFGLVPFFLIGLLSGSNSNSVIWVIMAFGQIFLFFLWIVMLLWGYISGFRVGWRYKGGIPLRDSVRLDYLARIYLYVAKRFKGRSSQNAPQTVL